ncbi:hypothetical protein [Enterobacter ludwigii]|uniref:hypothetical protein n=1 Tax=Enterobacter ludwigii TaxID=299767 RepID=UPI000B2502CA|nr:hypothetical protein [Enterobacter ludwigii]
MSKEPDKSNDPRKTIGMNGGIMDNCILENIHFDGYDTVFNVETMTNSTIKNLTARSSESVKLYASIRDSIITSTSTDHEAKTKIANALDEVEKAEKSSFLEKYATLIECLKNHVELYQAVQPWIARLGVIFLSGQ